MLTQEYLKSQLDYNPDTGLFIWLVDKKANKVKGKIAGSERKDKYFHIKLNKKMYLSHRLAFLYVYGYIPDIIDHINGNPSDNRICNLREATYSQNGCNSKIPNTNISGVKGISWHKQNKKWQASIKINKKFIYLGTYNTVEEAADIIKKARQKYHGEYANEE